MKKIGLATLLSIVLLQSFAAQFELAQSSKIGQPVNEIHCNLMTMQAAGTLARAH